MFLAVYSSQIYGLWQRFWRYVAAVAFHQALMKKKQPVAYATCLLMSVKQSCDDTICHASMNFGNSVQNFQQWLFKSPSDNEWKMKVYLKWKWSFSFSRICLDSYRFWKKSSTSKAFLHFMKSCWALELRNVSNEGQNMRKNWEKQQPSHLIASIWSFGFLKEIGFFLRSLNHLLNLQWRRFWPLFCHKTKASKIQPLYVWSATGKAHRSRSDLTSSRSKDVFEMSEDEEDACVGPKVAAVSKPRHMKPWGIRNSPSTY